MSKSKNDFWHSFETFIGMDIPNLLIEILSASGYDNALSVAEINIEEILIIENDVNKRLQYLLKDSDYYSNCDVFAFLPGHRKLLLLLAEKAKNFNPNKNKNEWDLSNASVIMKELINSMKQNANVAPQGRRYSEIIQSFATYIYILSGKAAYEVLCSNLPIPQAVTICKCNRVIHLKIEYS